VQPRPLPVVTCAECAPALRVAACLAVTAAPPGGAGSGLKPELRAAIDKFVGENKVVLFMKGNKQFPQARRRAAFCARLRQP
jgi:hypothetical protein